MPVPPPICFFVVKVLPYLYNTAKWIKCRCHSILMLIVLHVFSLYHSPAMKIIWERTIKMAIIGHLAVERYVTCSTHHVAPRHIDLKILVPVEYQPECHKACMCEPVLCNLMTILQSGDIFTNPRNLM